MSQEADRGDLEAQWRDEVGTPLVNALRHIRAWSMEINPKKPRYIGYLEFSARARGDLVYEDGSFTITDGLAHLLLKLSPIRFLEHDLICLILEQNTLQGTNIPEGLNKFLNGSGEFPDRPRKKGEDRLSRSLRKTLYWWGVQRGVDLGLKPAKNQYKAQSRHSSSVSCACDLVLAAFRKAGWSFVTYDMILTAWQEHRYMGSKDDRKANIRRNAAVFERRFKEIENLIDMLTPFDGATN